MRVPPLLQSYQRAVCSGRYAACAARQTVYREPAKARSPADWDWPPWRSSRMAAVWSGTEDPVLHPVVGLRPTRRVKRPVHPGRHCCGVPQFAGVLSVQGPGALHNGGQLGAAPPAPVDEKAEGTWSRPRRPGMWHCWCWSTGIVLDRLLFLDSGARDNG